MVRLACGPLVPLRTPNSLAFPWFGLSDPFATKSSCSNRSQQFVSLTASNVNSYVSYDGKFAVTFVWYLTCKARSHILGDVVRQIAIRMARQA